MKRYLQWKCIFMVLISIWPITTEKTRALLPLPDIQHNTFFEDAMTCDVVPELLGFNGHTIITLCGSKVINFLLPVLSWHADTKFTPSEAPLPPVCCWVFHKQPAKSKRDELKWRDKEHCSFTIDIECIIHSLALMWTTADYFDPHQAP